MYVYLSFPGKCRDQMTRKSKKINVNCFSDLVFIVKT